MGTTDTKSTLWRNVLRLMESRYGKENLTQLASDAGIGPGSVTRLKKMETSIGIDILEKIAEVFSVEPWQLLVPGLDPDALPSLGGDLSGWPMPLIKKEKFTSLPPDSRNMVQGYLLRLIDEQAAAQVQGQHLPRKAA